MPKISNLYVSQHYNEISNKETKKQETMKKNPKETSK